MPPDSENLHGKEKGESDIQLLSVIQTLTDYVQSHDSHSFTNS